PLRARAVQRWVQLLGRAERLMDSAPPADEDIQRRAGAALDALAAYEHELTPAERRQARETVWHRDHANEPLPAEPLRPEWARCRCRACAIAAELGRPSIRPELQRRLPRKPIPTAGAPACQRAERPNQLVSATASGAPVQQPLFVAAAALVA